MFPNRCIRGAMFGLSAASLLAPAATGQAPLMTVMDPANTGIPGEEVRIVRWGPDGNPWVAARWPFWQDGGIARYDLAANVWTVWSKGEYPIPSEYINDFEWDAEGVMWIATDAGLVR